MPASKTAAKNNNTPKRNGRKPKSKRNNQPTGVTNSRPVTAPAAVGFSENIRKASTRTTRRGTYLVKHSELVGSVAGSDAFSAVAYPINPGLSVQFPWLSQIAPNWESYRFHKLNFRYVNSVGSQQQGTFYMAPEFDVHDSLATSEQQLTSYDNCANTSVWKPVTYQCSKYNLQKRSTYYVRQGPVPANTDLSLYDVGYLTTGVVDCGAAPVQIGKLWVDYEIEFMTPQLGAIGVGRALSGKCTVTAAFASATMTGIAPLTASVAGGNSVTLTALEPYSCVVSGSSSGTPTLPNGAFSGTASITMVSDVSASGATVLYTGYINFTNVGQTFTVTQAGTVSSALLRFGQYDTTLG